MEQQPTVTKRKRVHTAHRPTDAQLRLSKALSQVVRDPLCDSKRQLLLDELNDYVTSAKAGAAMRSKDGQAPQTILGSGYTNPRVVALIERLKKEKEASALLAQQPYGCT